MALALSASLAHSENKCETLTEYREQIHQIPNQLCHAEPDGAIEKEQFVAQPAKDVPDVIMAGATVWWKRPQSPITKRKGVTKRTTAKTKLQTTTETERSQIISEKVAQILSCTER